MTISQALHWLIFRDASNALAATVADLAAKIVAQADALTDLGMALSGIRTKAQAALDAATTMGAIGAAKDAVGVDLAAVTA